LGDTADSPFQIRSFFDAFHSRTLLARVRAFGGERRDVEAAHAHRILDRPAVEFVGRHRQRIGELHRKVPRVDVAGRPQLSREFDVVLFECRDAAGKFLDRPNANIMNATTFDPFIAAGRNMPMPKLLSPVPIFPLLIAVSLIVGWSMPAFYEWTDSDQSRPSPLLWKVPLSLAIGSVAFCVALPWLRITTIVSSDAPRHQMRFSLRTLLLITAGVAVAIPLLARFPIAVSGIVCAGAFAYFLAFCLQNPQHRMAASALVACMALPYAWVVGYKELGRILPDLAVMVAGMPAFVPAALIGRLFGQNMHDVRWLTFLLTALELVIGIWIIRLGPKRTIAYLLFVMQLSVLGSLVFHMLVLA
jgi:hypothetical protein